MGSRAFFDDYNLTSIVFEGDVGTLEEYAIADVYNLTELTFSGSLEKIGVFSISNTNVTELVLPDSLRTIPEGAFAYNGNLMRLVLPRSLSSIGQNAFIGDFYLIYVYNRSNMSVTSDMFEYAPAVISKTESETTPVLYETEFVKFAKAGGTWYLYELRYDYNNEYTTVPDSFTVNGETVETYSVRSEAMRYTSSPVLLSDGVKSVERDSFAYGSTIYYASTREDWQKVSGYETTDERNITVLYYSQCIHYSLNYEWMPWRYDESHKVTFDETYFDETAWTVTKEPTCTAEGEAKIECPTCKNTITRILGKKEHEFTNDVCDNCGATRVVLTAQNANGIRGFDKGDFTVNGNKIGASKISIGSSVKFSIAVSENMTVRFVANVDGESDNYFENGEYIHDAFIIYRNGDIFWEIPNGSGFVAEFEVSAGDTLEFVYTNRVENTGSTADSVEIVDMTFIYPKEEQNNA